MVLSLLHKIKSYAIAKELFYNSLIHLYIEFENLFQHRNFRSTKQKQVRLGIALGTFTIEFPLENTTLG